MVQLVIVVIRELEGGQDSLDVKVIQAFRDLQGYLVPKDNVVPLVQAHTAQRSHVKPTMADAVNSALTGIMDTSVLVRKASP